MLLQARATLYGKISGRMFKEKQDPHGHKLFLPKYLLVTEEKNNNSITERPGGHQGH